jgi:hypothetical protein
MTMKENKSAESSPDLIPRRALLATGSKILAAIAVCTAAAGQVFAKAKSSKEDFYFQETPDDDGKNCSGCINFTPKSSGMYGADSGDCALLEGDVCNHCYCQGWTDKNAKGAKKAGT